MPAVAAGLFPGEILIEVNEARTGNVRTAPGAPSRLRVGEVMTAIANDPARVAKMGGERLNGDQGGVVHWFSAISRS